MHKPPGLLVLQLLGVRRLPEPLLSQRMSGLFRRIVLPTTVLLVGAVPPKPLLTTTPPEKAVGPDGTLDYVVPLDLHTPGPE